MTTTTTAAREVYVIPCSGDKLDHAAPARDFYTGTLFRHALNSVLGDLEACEDTNARVMILSAKHGLVDLDTTLSPYDVTIGAGGPNVVTATDLAVQIHYLGVDVFYAFLPAAYRDLLTEATELVNEAGEDDDLPWITVQDVYEAAPGVGHHRGVCSSLARTRGVR